MGPDIHVMRLHLLWTVWAVGAREHFIDAVASIQTMDNSVFDFDGSKVVRSGETLGIVYK